MPAKSSDGSILIDTSLDYENYKKQLKDLVNRTKEAADKATQALADVEVEDAGEQVEKVGGIVETIQDLLSSLGISVGATGAKVIGATTAITAGLAVVGVVAVKAFQSVIKITQFLGQVIQKVFTAGLAVIKVAIGGIQKLIKGTIEFIQSFIQGVMNAINQLSAMGDENDELRQSIVLLKETLAGVGKDIVGLFLPQIKAAVNWLVNLLNIIRQVIAALRGQSTWTKVVANDLEDAGEAGAAAAGSLAAFDEIDVLNQGGGGGNGEMFSEEEVTIAQELNDWVDRIKNKFLELWDVIEPFRGFLEETFGDFEASFLTPVSNWVVGEGWDEFIRITDNLMQNSDWEGLAGSLDKFYASCARFTIGIFEGLLTFYDRFLRPMAEYTISDALPRFLDATANALDKIDWDTINENFGIFLDSLSKIDQTIIDLLLTFYEDILLPIGEWVINEAVPRFFETLGTTLDILNTVLEALQPLWDDFYDTVLVPIAEWTSEKFLKFWDNFNKELDKLALWLEDNPDKIRKFFILLGGMGVGAVVGLTLALLGLVFVLGVIAVIIGLAIISIGLILVLIGAIITIIVTLASLLILGLVAAILYVIKHWKEMWKKVKFIWNDLKEKISNIMNIIKTQISAAIDKIKEKWENLKEKVKFIWNDLKEKISNIMNIIKTQISIAIDKIGEKWENLKEKVFSVADKLKTKWDTFITNFKDGLKSGLNVALGWVENFVNFFIRAINKMIGALNKINIPIPNIPLLGLHGGTIGFNIASLGEISIPRLAKGAIIPPNAEFAAILGDQRVGKNIETPEDLMRQIVREEISSLGDKEVTINFAGTLGALVRELKPYIDKENKRVGISLVQGIS